MARRPAGTRRGVTATPRRRVITTGKINPEKPADTGQARASHHRASLFVSGTGLIAGWPKADAAFKPEWVKADPERSLLSLYEIYSRFQDFITSSRNALNGRRRNEIGRDPHALGRAMIGVINPEAANRRTETAG